MNLFRQYKASLKNIEIENPLDLILLRPLAFFLVKLFYKTSITPNEISFLSIFTGILSGIFLSFGTRQSFVIGGILMILAAVIDCCDGMIARLKNNGTKTGRIIDGVADYITTVAIYIGFLTGLLKLTESGIIELPAHPAVLIVLCGIFTIIHAVTTDGIRNKYEFNVYHKSLDPELQIKEFKAELERINNLKTLKGHYLDKIVIVLYLGYTRLQLNPRSKKPVKYDADAYAKYNRIPVFLWNLIGISEHIVIFALSLILFKPIIFFHFTLIYANIWMVMMFIVQFMINRKMKKHRIETQPE